MNYVLSLFFLLSVIPTSEFETQNNQQEVLQSILNIEEFQKYLSYSPRFVGTNTRQEVLMLDFPAIENKELELKVRDKFIRIISEEQESELEHNFFIKIDEFELKKSTAEVLLSYQNSRLYYDKKQKILLDVQLEKVDSDDWQVKTYKLYEVSLNTSD